MRSPDTLPGLYQVGQRTLSTNIYEVRLIDPTITLCTQWRIKSVHPVIQQGWRARRRANGLACLSTTEMALSDDSRESPTEPCETIVSNRARRMGPKSYFDSREDVCVDSLSNSRAESPSPCGQVSAGRRRVRCLVPARGAIRGGAYSVETRTCFALSSAAVPALCGARVSYTLYFFVRGVRGACGWRRGVGFSVIRIKA